MTCPSKNLALSFFKSSILKFGFYNPIYLARSYLHVLNKNFWKFILEFSGLFYCSIIKVQGLYPTFVTNNSLLVFTDLLFASAIYILSLSFQLVKNFFILFFEAFQKNKTRKSLRFPTFASDKKTFVFKLYSLIALCDSDMYLTTFNCCCQHFFSFFVSHFPAVQKTNL